MVSENIDATWTELLLPSGRLSPPPLRRVRFSLPEPLWLSDAGLTCHVLHLFAVRCYRGGGGVPQTSSMIRCFTI